MATRSRPVSLRVGARSRRPGADVASARPAVGELASASTSARTAARPGSGARRSTAGSASTGPGAMRRWSRRRARCCRRTPARVIELAIALKRENLDRTAAQIHAILTAAGETGVPTARTLQTHLTRAGLNHRADGRTPSKVYGRFEATAPNALWTGDGLHGPKLAARAVGRCCWRSSTTTRGCWSAGGG